MRMHINIYEYDYINSKAIKSSVVVVVGNAEADAVRALELDRFEPRPLLEFDREARV